MWQILELRKGPLMLTHKNLTLTPTPDVHAKWVPVQNSCQVGDGRANLVSHSEAVLVAARREEGGGLMPRRPCDSFLFC